MLQGCLCQQFLSSHSYAVDLNDFKSRIVSFTFRVERPRPTSCRGNNEECKTNKYLVLALCKISLYISPYLSRGIIDIRI